MNAKFKKHLIFLASLLLTIGTPLLSSCNGSKNSSNNNDNANDGMNMVERTVNPEIANIVAESDKEIKISYELAAYGSEWIKRAVEQFNYIYEVMVTKQLLAEMMQTFKLKNVFLKSLDKLIMTMIYISI